MSVWFRRFVVLAAACITMFAAWVCYLRIFGGNTLQKFTSPDGAVIAEVNSSGASGATDTAYIGVMLRSRLNPFREYVLAGLNHGVRISIAWTDSKTLLITCNHCEHLDGGNIKLDHWHDITIHYQMISR